MNTYRSPQAFQQALKAKLSAQVRESGGDFNRRLQLLLFDRFMLRVYDALGDTVILKGGFALEIRFARARTTRDVDLRVTGAIEDVVTKIRRASAGQGEDYLTFTLSDGGTELAGDQLVYDGRRYHVQATLAGRRFGAPFHLDLSVADRLLLKPERFTGPDLLAFAGLLPVEHRVYPAETHVAEKLHALTVPRPSPNSRTKDLIDVGLLGANERFEAGSLMASIAATFEFRQTHDMPQHLPPPPEFWHASYARIVAVEELIWTDLNELQAFSQAFLDPLLGGDVVGESMWSPKGWS